MSTKVMINGREISIPDAFVTGDEIKAFAGIAPERLVIQQKPTGNFLIHDNQKYPLNEGDYFSDAPAFKYG